METKKQTNVELRQNEASRLKCLIIVIMEITELQYCEYQFEQGLAYLNLLAPHDNGQLRYSKLFWQWFKNHWSLTDEIYVQAMRHRKFSVKAKRRLYESMHNVEDMYNDMKPHVELFIEKKVWLKIQEVQTII